MLYSVLLSFVDIASYCAFVPVQNFNLVELSLVLRAVFTRLLPVEVRFDKSVFAPPETDIVTFPLLSGCTLFTDVTVPVFFVNPQPDTVLSVTALGIASYTALDVGYVLFVLELSIDVTLLLVDCKLILLVFQVFVESRVNLKFLSCNGK